MKTVVVTSVLLLFAACASPPVDPPSEGEGEGEGEDCALTPLARELLEQTLNEHFTAAAFATSRTHGGFAVDMAFAMDLVGLDVGVLQNATFVVPCTEPTSFEPTCETTLSPEPPVGPFFQEHDRCFRLGCIDADVPFVDAYFTMQPNTAADERHVFTVTTASPTGASSYGANPLVRWVADLTAPDTVALHADIDIAHVFTADGESVVLDHTGVVDGVAAADEVTLDVALSFAALSVQVAVHADDTGALTGSITRDGDVLATLDAPLDLARPVPFAWIEGCE